MTNSPVERRLLGLLRADVVTRRQFEILILRYEHNLSLAQIAFALDIGRSTVTSTIARAHQKIRLHSTPEAA